MAAPVLGIDLGTTNSVVAVANEQGTQVLAGADGTRLVPSVVSFHPSGSVLVGSKARERRLIDARNTVYSTKRLIGRPFKSLEVSRAQGRFPFELEASPTGGVLVKTRGESYTLSEIGAFVLREVRSRAEAALGQACTQAVITVPANFNELQRAATKAAGRVAGLDVLRILNEPTAAALAYGFSAGKRERVAVFDLGGGTFDLTVLDLAGEVFEVLATAGDSYLGGDDLDTALAEKMAETFLAEHRSDVRSDAQAFERLRAASEWAKCQLSHQDEVQLRIEELAYGENGAALDLSFTITRSEVEKLTVPLFGRCFDVCADALRSAGVRVSQLDTVVLVGGSTRIPLVRRMVAEYFEQEPQVQVDPDLVVAEGAAIQGLALATARRRRASQASLSDATPPPSATDWSDSGTKPRAVPLAALELSKVPATKVGTPPAPPPVPSVPPPVPSDAAAVTMHAPIPVGTPPPAPREGSSDRWSSAPPPEMPSPEDATNPMNQATLSGVLREATGSFELPVDGKAPPPPPPPPPPPVPPVARAVRTSQPVANPAFQPPPMANPFNVETPPVELTAPDAARPGPGPMAPPEPGAVDVSAFERGALDSSPGVNVGVPVSAADDVPTPAMPAEAMPPDAMSSGAMSLDALPVPSGPPAAPPLTGEAGSVAPLLGMTPLLLDVTPLSLGVETVDGYCEAIIQKNAAIPTEQTRLFTTARDGQTEVAVRICQGEDKRIEGNQLLGELQLFDLPAAVRGAVKVEVTFILDADGTLQARAEDKATGKAQSVRIQLVGAIREADVGAMQQRVDARYAPPNS